MEHKACLSINTHIHTYTEFKFYESKSLFLTQETLSDNMSVLNINHIPAAHCCSFPL